MNNSLLSGFKMVAKGFLLLLVVLPFTQAVAPQITVHPQNATTTEGENVTLSCNATGDPAPLVYWTKSGSIISISSGPRISFGADNKTLTIMNVSRGDSGQYRCVANNSAGENISITATLDVQYQPEISTHPISTVITEGGELLLTCNATGNPAPSISWTKDGFLINGSGDPRISFTEQNTNLSVTNVSRADVGQYRCVASNSLGNTSSNAAILDVQYQPEITTHPVSTLITEGGGLLLTCNATGNPTPSISWIKGGSSLTTGDDPRIIFGADNRTFTITNVSRADDGQYVCVASNTIGNVTSNNATLDVQYAPEFTKNPENIVKIEGEVAVFNCLVEGNPQPSIKWTKNNNVLNIEADPDLSETLSGNNHSLTVQNVYRSDEGQYRCVANNSIDNTTSDAGTLRVRFVPEVRIEGAAKQFVVVENEILLTCPYNTSPPASEVQWLKDGTVISRNASMENETRGNIAHFNESIVQLTINSSTTQDAGNYTCLVINSIFNSSDTTEIVIQVVPDPPMNLKVGFKGSRVVIVSWTAGFDGNSGILNYTVEISEDNQNFTNAKCQGLSSSVCVISSSSINASLEGLLPWTTYYIRVFATNKVGPSGTSSVVNITTDEEAPSVAPPFSVTVVSSTTVNVSWQMLTKEQARGATLGYFILYKKTDSGSKENQTVLGKEITSFLLTSLKEYTPYQFSMQAFNSKGVSNESAPLERRTDEDKPDGAPQNVSGHNSSSTSILVTWDEVPVEQQNGIITSYTITYQSQTENHNESVPAGPSDRQKNITGLKEYVPYNITVFASTVKGDGPHSTPVLVIRTDQDTPSASPSAVEGHNTSSTSILFQWGNVPQDDQNGVILSYTVIYKALPGGSPNNTTVNASTTQVTLTGLNEYTNYSITVVASTVKGAGIVSSPIIVITDEDKPDGAPQNVSGHNSSSTSILVTWDEVPVEQQNGVITGYIITYQSQTENHNGNFQAGPSDRQKNITGLKEYVYYNITVFASTVKGDGPHSTPSVIARTDQDKPDGAPQNVNGHNTGSRSILVTWDEVPVEQQNGIITGYTITYQSQTENHNGSVPAGPSDRQKNITGLKEYVTYNISVFASTVKGDGPHSTPVVVARTDQDKPDGAPQNVSGHNSSSTSILVTWGEVPVEQQNGIITGYTITYQSQRENHNGSVPAGPSDRQQNITGLKEYVYYNITMFASTVKGNGPYSTPSIIVRTDQDKPDGAPQNVNAHNSSSKSILVTWDEVPVEQQNGIITGYTITYQSQTENDNGSVPADPSDRQKNITGLKEYVDYNITVFASTVKGDGPPSTPVLVVRTDQDEPDGAPQNVSGQNSSSTSILVTWDEVPVEQQNGVITGYTITYQSQTENHNGNVSADPSDRQKNITGLKEYVAYNITMFASSVKGDGPHSTPVLVLRTDQDRPAGAPQNVSGYNSSSTSIRVTWEVVPVVRQNGIIIKYTITYRSLTTDFNGNVTVTGNPPALTGEITGLREYVEYNITVFASTVKGDGPHSTAIVVRTEQDKPDGAPQNVNGHNSSSTSIRVSWDKVPHEQQNGVILSYNITYQSLTESDSGTVQVRGNPPLREKEITGLKDYVAYNITVFASTVKGDGPHSTAIVVRTDQDKPDGPPRNVNGQHSSSTSIRVSWEEVPVVQRNGIIIKYTIIYRSLTENHSGNVTVTGNPPARTGEITGLRKYVEYNITVFASTMKGDGPHSTAIVVRTDQDKPDGAPQNISGYNTSSTSVRVSWEEVPFVQRNGIIIKYTITYQSHTEYHNGNVEVNGNPPNLTGEITGLREYVEYNITVFASTVKGGGPHSTAIVVRTDQDKPSGAPLNLRPVDTTFSSILVTWDEVAPADKNGVILSYTVSYQEVGGDSVNASSNTTTVDFPTQQANLTGLRNDTRYNISVLATTVKGDGPHSDSIFVSTNQGKPSAAPDNVRGRYNSSTEIIVQWDEVPTDKQNGEILHYTVVYRKTQGGEKKRKLVNFPTRDVTLTNLAKFSFYSITVSAATVKGDGPDSIPIELRTDEDKPSASPSIIKVKVLNSTSVLVEWEVVPEQSRHGIITQYTIHYKGTVKGKESAIVVKAPAVNATINGLKQKTEYSFWISAATSKGNGPPSGTKKATTDAVPTVAPPADDVIGSTNAVVKFVNKKTLSNGNPVRYFRMIVIPLVNGKDPGNPADENYQNVTRVHENRTEGEPYITAEFARQESRTTFTVGDGKYYSRDGITDAPRKRRAVSSPTKYLNGKLDHYTEYAVFQRSFDKDDRYENEGFIQFTTKEETKVPPTEETTSPTPIIVSVVVVFIVLLILAGAILIWRRRSQRNGMNRNSGNIHDGSKQEVIEMSSNKYQPTETTYYNAGQLHDEYEVAGSHQGHTRSRPAAQSQITYENVMSSQVPCYGNVNPQRGDIYQEIKEDTHYRSLDVNRQVDYEQLRGRRVQPQADNHYEPLSRTEQIYENQSR